MELAFPSLLYIDHPGEPRTDIEAFRDLMLTRLIPEEALPTVLAPCTKDDIAARRELLCELRGEKLDAAKRLARSAELVFEEEETAKEAGCDEEYAFAFVSLICRIREFAKLASEFETPGVLARRFSDFARNLYRKTDAFAHELEEKKDALGKIKSATFELHESRMKLSSDTEKSYLQTIRECATELKIPCSAPRNFGRMSLSPETVRAYAKLHPDAFAEASKLCEKYGDLYDDRISRYKDELKLCICAAELRDKIEAAGIPLNFAQISDERVIEIKNAYDISLLAKDETNIVPNDIEMNEREPFFFVTGANGGGKTTYLRALGIALAMHELGLPVACTEARIGNIDTIMTHFPHDERFDGTGRFEEEHGRAEAIRKSADKSTLVLLNETYSATNEERATELTEKLALELFSRGIFGLYITHTHKSSDSPVPCLTVCVDDSDEHARTYKISRKAQGGGSFASDILKKYGLRACDLERRFGGEKSK